MASTRTWLFKWRREHREAQAFAAAPARAPAPLLLPITLDSTAPMDASPPPAAVTPPADVRASAGSIELDFAGARLRLRGAVDPQSLVALLAALRSLA